MEFGKVKITQLENIDFQFPDDLPINRQILGEEKAEKVNVYIGCPIWVNKNWLGKIYPPKTKEKDFLKYYAQQFNTIELNSTHYHLPDSLGIERWKQKVKPEFRFCPKVLQEISHYQLVDKNYEKLTEEFCEQISLFGEQLGICFLQLPPYFGTDKSEILQEFLSKFSKNIPLAIEFRHPTWFLQNQEPLKNIIKTLQEYNTSTVITDVAGRRDVLHQCLSSKTAVIRFVGNALHQSDYTRIEGWVERLKNWIDVGIENIYFWVHQPNNDLAPELCDYFIQQFNEKTKLDIEAPKFYQNPAQQGSLF